MKPERVACAVLLALAFELERVPEEKRLHSTGRITLDGVVLCEARMSAVAGDRSRLPEVSPRRNARARSR